jgi:hypothetical protein
VRPEYIFHLESPKEEVLFSTFRASEAQHTSHVSESSTSWRNRCVSLSMPCGMLMDSDDSNARNSESGRILVNGSESAREPAGLALPIRIRGAVQVSEHSLCQ